MRQGTTTIVVMVAVALAASFAFSQRNEERRGQGVLGVLSKGQPVTVKEAGERYEIGVMAAGPAVLGYTVVEVGDAYLVVEDIARVRQLRIPIFSIKAVSVLTR